MSRATLYCGDALDVLKTLPEESAQCVVTSPPYWGLRDYGVRPSLWGADAECIHEWVDQSKYANSAYVGDSKKRWQHQINGRGEMQGHKRAQFITDNLDVPAGSLCALCGAWYGALGLEPDPQLYVDHVVEFFAAVHRVLAPDGTLWLNIGDCYAGAPHGNNGYGTSTLTNQGDYQAEKPYPTSAGPRVGHGSSFRRDRREDQPHKRIPDLKPKDLVGQPWRVAFALQAAGWWLRADLVWSKPNPMPESVRDRPTRAHEYVFLLAKSERYYYNQKATLEPVSPNTHMRMSQDVASQVGSARANGGTRADRPMKAVGRAPGVNPNAATGVVGREKQNASFAEAVSLPVTERNARSVWEISTQPYSGAHFATFPEELARRCIVAGSRPGDTVLDPFGGSGTVAQVATGNGRDSIYIDLNPEYLELARQRIGPMLCDVVAA